MHTSISALFRKQRSVEMLQGETVFLREQSVDHVYLVRSGRVHLLRHTQHGSTMILQNAGHDTILAEASVYSLRYHCTAVAAETATLAALPKAVFLSALAKDTELAQAWSAMLACCVQRERMRAEIRTLPTVAERLDAWLAEGNTLPDKGHWQDVAAELGVSREALYRELSRRRRQNQVM